MTNNKISANRAENFKVLDSWRGVSACFVVLLHFMANSHFYDVPIIRSAGFFVDFFFVLSGFVIFANYEERLIKGFGFIKFMFLRFGRLYPLHIAILAVFVGTELLQIIIPGLNSLADNKPFTNVAEGPMDILSQVFLFHALDTQAAKGFNAPSWSISAEFYTYMVFAAALIFCKNRIYLFCVAMFIIINVFLVTIFTVQKEFLFIEGFFRCLSGFSAGALCWLFWKTYKDKILTLSLPSWKWSILEFSVIVAGYFMIAYTAQTPYKYSCGILFSMAVILFAFEKGYVSQILKNKVFALLGLLSYSIYMNHVFIASKVTPVLADILESKFGLDLLIIIDGREKIGITKWQGDIISIIYLLVVIGVSLLTFHIIEKPFRDWFKRIAYKKSK